VQNDNQSITEKRIIARYFSSNKIYKGMGTVLQLGMA
jgi:hypothetical protein